MEHGEANEHTSLKADDATPSDLGSTSNAVTSPAEAASVHQRHSYHRISSFQEEQDISYHGATAADEDHGLGIQNLKDTKQGGPSIEISFDHDDSPDAPGSAGFLLSPLSRSSTKKYRPLEGTPEDNEEFEPDGRSRSPSLFRPFTADSETDTLRRAPPRTSTLSPYGPTGGEHPDFTCTTQQHFHHARGELSSILVLIASAFSTVFSAIWLGLATGKPHYGQIITTNSKLPPSTASLLVAAFAKSIELTFVTSFVAFLGQLLSQRAFRKNSNGITVAEMQMRTWILQPGTLVTHGAAVRYAALTLLGALALFTALLAIFYTTASDALVSPKLKFGSLQDRVLYGNVSVSFANETYIEDHCASPIALDQDPLHKGQTCIAIEHSGQAYHNYAQYLTDWTNALVEGNVSTDLKYRPPPVGTLYDNTTVNGSWIDVQDMTENSKNFKRMVNNVSLAMPHAGVFAAATDPKNRIIQPRDLDGLGEYYLEASVPSPAINVLCAAMTEDELTPIVMQQWPAYKDKTVNVTTYVGTGAGIPDNSSWFNATAVDGIFGFGEKYGRRPPIFPLLPDAFNTIMNYSSFPLDTDSLYVLAKSNSSGASPYALCSLRASLTPECSTIYHSTMSGGQMYTHCEDSHNRLAYGRSQPSATSGVYNKGWRDVAAQWGIALSLNAGVTDGQASNARLISQFIPSGFSLDPKLPSIAEALAVLAGCTLLMGTFDTPFVHYWNYSDPNTLLTPKREPFNATLMAQDYSSGGIQRWQDIFYVILASVFFINLFCLGYFITHTGLVTDFMEPQNLFALSLNSPPSQVLEGTCGGGPRKEHYRSTWHIWMNRSEHFYIESTDDPLTRRRGHKHEPSQDIDLKSPVSQMYNRLSKKRSSVF